MKTVVKYLLLALMLMCCAHVRAMPTTAPSDHVLTVQLEDPISPQSKCYVDLDTGNTFARGETAGDVMQSSAWIRKNGIDLMCESREPANGLVAYDTAVLPTDATIDHPPEYATARLQFAHAEAQHFDFVSPPDALPKTYLVRTGDGAFGLLEITEKLRDPGGWKLRFRTILPSPPPVFSRRSGPIVFAFGPDAALRTTRVQLQQQLTFLETTYGRNHPEVRRTQAALDAVNRQISDAEYSRRKKALGAATQPANVAPVTRPVAEDFHL